jgi:hypothetical protein
VFSIFQLITTANEESSWIVNHIHLGHSQYISQGLRHIFEVAQRIIHSNVFPYVTPSFFVPVTLSARPVLAFRAANWHQICRVPFPTFATGDPHVDGACSTVICLLVVCVLRLMTSFCFDCKCFPRFIVPEDGK